MNKQQKGNAVIWFIIIVVVVVAVWYFMKNGYKVPGIVNNTTPAVQSTADLDSVNKQLDGTNLNQMDTGISQVSADSASF